MTKRMCKDCGKIKVESNRKYCDRCSGIHHREYIRLYHQRPDIKKKMKEYHKERAKKPGMIRERREYQREYGTRPGVAEKRRIRQRERYRRTKSTETSAAPREGTLTG